MLTRAAALANTFYESYTDQMKAKIVLWRESKGINFAQTEFMREYDASNFPDPTTMLRWRNKFLETGSVCDRPHNRAYSVWTEELEEKILGIIHQITIC